MDRIVVGVDLCRGSWAGIRLRNGAFDGGGVFPSLEQIATSFGKLAVTIAVDIPLSYPPDGRKGRRCETEGRALLGPRRSSMFDTYPQHVLAAGSHSKANALALETIGCGLSQQSYALGPAIREAIAWSQRDPRIHETHPELVYWNLAGRLASKKSWSGFRQRLAALEGIGIHLPVAFPEMDQAALDDVLDAAAATWVADRIALGQAKRLPAQTCEPAIWY